MTDLSAWYTKAQACAKLGGVSERTLDRLVARGHVEKRKRPIRGRKPEPLYRPEDVARIMENHDAAPAVLAPDAGTPLPRRNKPREEAAPLWLTYEEAVAYSGLPRGTLARLVREETIMAIRAGATRLRRADLDRISRPETDPAVHVRALLPLLSAVLDAVSKLPAPSRQIATFPGTSE